MPQIKTMETYCEGCKKNNANKNSSVKETKQNRFVIVSNCAVCDKEKSSFIKNQQLYQTIVFIKFKMNKTVIKFLLTEDKFMLKLNLTQLVFTYNACGPFIKYRYRIKKIREANT